MTSPAIPPRTVRLQDRTTNGHERTPLDIVDTHPEDGLLRAERFPHIWCPGCGLGNVLRAYAEAVEGDTVEHDKHVCVSGIGCTGRSAGYVDQDSYHTTHGRAIPFATGLKLADPSLRVSVISGDGDLTTIGGNHLIHAARRNIDLTVICVNNFNYGMTGGQAGATTPHGASTSTTRSGNPEYPFNLPYLVAAAGAPFVARWTSLHVRQLRQAIGEALAFDGFAFVEVLSPCPIGFGAKNGYPVAIDEMRHFREHAKVEPTAPLDTLEITMAKEDPMILGQFVRKDRPSLRAAQATMDRRAPGGAK